MLIRHAFVLLSLSAIPLFSQAGASGTARPPSSGLDLVLLIGQSNMAGRGMIEAQDREPHPRIWSLNKELAWVPAIDPLHWDKPDIAGVGMGRSVARTLLAAKPSANIGLIPCAFGGTSLEQWKPGGELYEAAVRRTRAALQSGTLRAILWHQGESDSGKEDLARSYGDRLAAMIGRLRSDLDAQQVPLVAGQLGEFFSQAPFAAVVNQQLAMIPLRIPRSVFVPSGGLRHKGDNVHFDSASFRELGRRYACALMLLDPAWWQSVQ